MKIGLSYETAYALPFGELCDLIAVEQIRNEKIQGTGGSGILAADGLCVKS